MKNDLVHLLTNIIEKIYIFKVARGKFEDSFIKFDIFDNICLYCIVKNLTSKFFLHSRFYKLNRFQAKSRRILLQIFYIL